MKSKNNDSSNDEKYAGTGEEAEFFLNPQWLGTTIHRVKQHTILMTTMEIGVNAIVINMLVCCCCCFCINSTCFEASKT